MIQMLYPRDRHGNAMDPVDIADTAPLGHSFLFDTVTGKLYFDRSLDRKKIVGYNLHDPEDALIGMALFMEVVRKETIQVIQEKFWAIFGRTGDVSF